MNSEELKNALINETPVRVKNWRIGEQVFSKIDAIMYKKAKPKSGHQIVLSVRLIESDTRNVFEVSADDVEPEVKE